MNEVFAAPVRGRSHSGLQRLLATAVLVAGLLAAGRLLWTQPAMAEGSALWFLLALVGALVGSYLFMVTAVTTISAEGLHQRGLPDRRVRWEEVASARVAGPAFARRLVIRTLGGRRVPIAGATPELLAAFERIAARYQADRR